MRWLLYVACSASCFLYAIVIQAEWQEPMFGVTRWSAINDSLTLGVCWMILAELHKDR